MLVQKHKISKGYHSSVLLTLITWDVLTAQKPDLVIINRKTKEVKLVELTVPWDTSNNMTAAMKRKTEPYEELVTTITGNGFECQNTPH